MGKKRTITLKRALISTTDELDRLKQYLKSLKEAQKQNNEIVISKEKFDSIIHRIEVAHWWIDANEWLKEED